MEHAATSILVGKYFLLLKSVAIKKAIAVIGNIVKNSVLSQRNVILKSGKLRLKPAICKAKLGGAQAAGGIIQTRILTIMAFVYFMNR